MDGAIASYHLADYHLDLSCRDSLPRMDTSPQLFTSFIGKIGPGSHLVRSVVQCFDYAFERPRNVHVVIDEQCQTPGYVRTLCMSMLHLGSVNGSTPSRALTRDQ